MNKLRTLIGKLAPLMGFRGSKHYWETRYRLGGHSGEGSRGKHATYKAEVLNDFFDRHQVDSVIEFGCGDGHQLGMLRCGSYTGVDISPTIIETCRGKYPAGTGKSFVLADEYDGTPAELAMSLDVIFHLVEDDVYDNYLDRLFSAATRYVVIYSTSDDMASTGVSHVRHRDVASDCAQRYPHFARMLDDEARLPPPTRFDRGLPTLFHFFERVD